MKSLNIILFAPAIFYVFPDWPQWIAQLFPTYWVINPIFALAICAVAVPVVVVLGRRLQGQVAAA